jgi:hypothetical protein
MALTTAEKALAAVIGIETARPGTTGAASRKAIMAGARAILAGTIRFAPAAARTTGRTLGALSPQGRLLLAGITAAEAYDRGLLDAPIQAGREAFVESTVAGLEQLRPFMPQSGPPEGFEGFGIGGGTQGIGTAALAARLGNIRGRPPTAHNQAVSAGMKALKASKYDGPKGKLRKPKASFSKVNKTVSKLKRRKKVARTGATGVIARAVKKFI